MIENQSKGVITPNKIVSSHPAVFMLCHLQVNCYPVLTRNNVQAPCIAMDAAIYPLPLVAVFNHCFRWNLPAVAAAGIPESFSLPP